MNLTVNHVINEAEAASYTKPSEQLDLFTDYEKKAQVEEEKAVVLAKERKVQEALLDIKAKFGKNAILKGLSFEEGATAKDRNQQIGGHKA
jgi:DNA polymerase V